MPDISQVNPTRASTLGIYLSTYTSASSLPQNVLSALKENERAANVILPHALAPCHDDVYPGQLWITCATAHSSTTEPHLDFILSCTEWHMGTYPIFIISTLPTAALTPAFLAPRIAMITAELQACVSVDRVYSVFAPAPIAKALSLAWANFTSVEIEEQPYYAARFTHVTIKTLIDSPPQLLPDYAYDLRLATEKDLVAVAALCKGFAAESEPFILDDRGAMKEARYLVSSKMAWVHEIIRNGSSEIACLVAVTRNSDNIATITKVFTPSVWRKRGCAERLVRRVCKHYLYERRKQYVVLYVAHNNPAAAKVYDKVGFASLCGKPRVEGVDDWIEFGFRDSALGHW